MSTLTIKSFSCIKSAEIEVRPLTILIGPQASGKSVITKLNYFFSDILRTQYSSAEDGNNVKIFRKELAQSFSEWFPPAAWGKLPFEIHYRAGPLEFHVRRRHNTKRVYDEVEIETSKFFNDQYEKLLASYRSLRKRKKDDDDEISFASLDRTWRVQSASWKFLREALKRDFISHQIFVPAGRSFFTNLGKAVAMLEHGSQLDDLTKRFGRLFTSLLDGSTVFYGSKPSAKSKEFLARQKRVFSNIFGGTIKISHNDRHVDTDDGRKITFSVLSSGQQELLPLLLILQSFTRGLVEGEGSTSEAIYVEEPEAHLFPSAQGKLTTHIATVSNFVRERGSFIITTHSPYVLSTLNNLIKAHMVAKKGGSDVAKAVSLVIPSEAWLPPAAIGAYALQNGELSSIKDESGLLDGSYLDSISNDISSDFLQLLEIEDGSQS